MPRLPLAAALLAGLLVPPWTHGADGPERARITWVDPPPPARGEVLLQASPDAALDDARTNQPMFTGSRLFTRALGQAAVTLTGAGSNSIVRAGPLSELAFVRRARSPVELARGVFYFLARGEPFSFEFETPHVIGGHQGTDFALTVTPEETVVTLFDGELRMTNTVVLEDGVATAHPVTLTNRFQQAILATNRPPLVLAATNLVQWWLEYPAVIVPDELPLDDDMRARLGPSLAAYATGDLRGALLLFPTNAPARPADGERVYQAALALVQGRTDEAQAALAEVRSLPSLTNAIHLVIEAVTGTNALPVLEPCSASEWLGYSYLLQARHDLAGALRATTNALALAPGFAATRVRAAELHFARGDRRRAAALLDDDPETVARHPGAQVLRGFFAAGVRRPGEAIPAFEHALGLDPSSSTAWLGRGLGLISAGGRTNLAAGLADLKTAAGADPGRALLRSYLGKGFQVAGDFTNAARELEFARTLDPNDPTPWLYLGLLRQQENRINEGIGELTESAARNNNRRVYRSQLLLDQDRAVRGANLARLYQDAGLSEVAVREATRAVGSDYASAAAHLFLANSYDTLRDPGQADLRYETAWFSELLTGNLLAPVGAGQLAPTLSANEYGMMFERNRPLAVASTTEYLSSGAWRQSGALQGLEGRLEYAFEAHYVTEPGERVNEDVESWSLWPRVKYQLGPSDTLYLQANIAEYDAGDTTRYLDPASANPELRVSESIEPIVLAGHHHEWSPGQHTLVLLGGFRDEITVTDPLNQVPAFTRNTVSGLINRAPYPARVPSQRDALATQDLTYSSRFEGLSLDLQHIAALGDAASGGWGSHSLVGGARLQTGEFSNQVDLDDGESMTYGLAGPGSTPLTFSTPTDQGDTGGSFDRVTLYAYDQWQVRRWLTVTLGLAYDHLYFPQNHRVAPLSDEMETADELSPKAGLAIQPWTNGLIRAAYTRSLGGVAFDQSFRLEPTQVAGVNQAFRSLIPESVSGPLVAPVYEVAGIGLDQRFGDRTYFTAAGAWRASDVDRLQGAFQTFLSTSNLPPVRSGLRDRLEYEQWELSAGVYQLLDRQWTLGFTYLLDDSTLTTTLSDAATPAVAGLLNTEQQARLHQLGPRVFFNSAGGWFGSAEALWTTQSGTDPAAGDFGEDFWQVNLFAGYRFWRRQVEARIGLLNVTDDGHRLHPLNLTPRYPQSRTLSLSLRFAL